MLLTFVVVCVAALVLLIAVPAYIAFRTHNRLVALDQRCTQRSATSTCI
jgi:LemA protein